MPRKSCEFCFREVNPKNKTGLFLTHVFLVHHWGKTPSRFHILIWNQISSRSQGSKTQNKSIPEASYAELPRFKVQVLNSLVFNSNLEHCAPTSFHPAPLPDSLNRLPVLLVHLWKYLSGILNRWCCCRSDHSVCGAKCNVFTIIFRVTLTKFRVSRVFFYKFHFSK